MHIAKHCFLPPIDHVIRIAANQVIHPADISHPMYMFKVNPHKSVVVFSGLLLKYFQYVRKVDDLAQRIQVDHSLQYTCKIFREFKLIGLS